MIMIMIKSTVLDTVLTTTILWQVSSHFHHRVFVLSCQHIHPDITHPPTDRQSVTSDHFGAAVLRSRRRHLSYSNCAPIFE